jgi:hypothetical protein
MIQLDATHIKFIQCPLSHWINFICVAASWVITLPMDYNYVYKMQISHASLFVIL